MNATIQGYMIAVKEATASVQEYRLRVSSLQKQLREAQSDLVGAQEQLRFAKNVLTTAQKAQVYEEITSREVDIARMKGIELTLGEELTPVIKYLLEI